MNEWVGLKTMQDVAKAKSDGWEIRFLNNDGIWADWHGKSWGETTDYIGRPKRPKPEPKLVTSECWRNKRDGSLIWDNTVKGAAGWQRFPAGDITGEVKE